MRQLVIHLRFTFALFVVVGAAAIFATSMLVGVNAAQSQTKWILMSFVVALMFIFGLVVWIRSQGEHASDSDAETFYYLGFIYTLLTLVATFTPLLAEGTKPSTQHVLGMFGLGLITTFVGLAGRVFFLQGHSSDAPDTGYQRLGLAYTEAARQLEATTLQMARVGNELEKVTKKSQENIASSLEITTRKISDDFQKLFEEANKRVTLVTTNTAESIGNTLRATAAGLVTVLEEFRQRLNALKLPPSDFGERLGKTIDALLKATSAATESISRIEASIGAANGEVLKLGPGALTAANALHTLAGASKAVSGELNQNDAGLSNLRIRVVGLQEALTSSTPSVKQFGHVAQGVATDIAAVQKSVVVFNSAIEGLSGEATKAGSALSQLGAHVTDIAGHLHQLFSVISASEELARKINETQVKVSSELGRGVDLLKGHHESVEKLSRNLEIDLQASEEALRKVHKNLIAATEFVTSKIQ